MMHIRRKWTPRSTYLIAHRTRPSCRSSGTMAPSTTSSSCVSRSSMTSLARMLSLLKMNSHFLSKYQIHACIPMVERSFPTLSLTLSTGLKTAHSRDQCHISMTIPQIETVARLTSTPTETTFAALKATKSSWQIRLQIQTRPS